MTTADTSYSSNDSLSDVIDEAITLLYRNVVVDEQEFEEAWQDVANQMQETIQDETSEEEWKQILAQLPHSHHEKFREYLKTGLQEQHESQKTQTHTVAPTVSCHLLSLLCYMELFRE